MHILDILPVYNQLLTRKGYMKIDPGWYSAQIDFCFQIVNDDKSAGTLQKFQSRNIIRSRTLDRRSHNLTYYPGAYHYNYLWASGEFRETVLDYYEKSSTVITQLIYVCNLKKSLYESLSLPVFLKNEDAIQIPILPLRKTSPTRSRYLDTIRIGSQFGIC